MSASWDSVYLVLKATNSLVSIGYDTTSVRKLMQVRYEFDELI